MAQTIQRTAKPYKAMIATGKVSMIIGTPVLFFNHHVYGAAAAMGAAFAIYLLGKIGAWWSNG